MCQCTLAAAPIYVGRTKVGIVSHSRPAPGSMKARRRPLRTPGIRQGGHYG